MKKITRILALIVYYGFAYYLPDSYTPYIGKISNRIRIFLCKRIFKQCGKISTINRKVYFGSGSNVVIGDYSGIGAEAFIPNNIIIGKYVLWASQVHIVAGNHEFRRTDIPIASQGAYDGKKRIQTIIEDDCWLCTRAILTPGRTVKKGTIVAAGSVLTKDFPEYSIVGGNPAKLIKNRKDNG